MKSKKRKKSKYIINIEYYIFLIAAFTARLIPSSIIFFLSKHFARVLFYCSSKYRKRTISHMIHSGLVTDYSEAKKLALQNFMHLSKLFVELMTIGDLITPEFVKEKVKITASDETKEFLFKTDKPAIILSAHYGSWEIAGRVLCILSKVQLLVVIRPFDNPRIGEYFYELRRGDYLEFCSKNGAVKKIFKKLRNNGRVSLLVDQHASKKDGVLTKFFNQPASTHSSPALLQLKTKTPIFVFVLKNNPDGYELIIKDEIKYEQQYENEEKDIATAIIAQKYTNDIEDIIKKDPLQWLWAPRRWLNINRKKR